MREADVSRATAETDIQLRIVLEGQGKAEVDTGIGFFDHMLCSFARFARVDLQARCKGDLRVDAHHTVEDVGICLGKALARALGDKQGIRRVASVSIPMDEALATAALDISGRPYLVFDARFAAPTLGAMDAQLVEEFFRAVSTHAGLTLHLAVPYGRNDHHKAEALFKAFGCALEQAASVDPRVQGALSTKGIL